MEWYVSWDMLDNAHTFSVISTVQSKVCWYDDMYAVKCWYTLTFYDDNDMMLHGMMLASVWWHTSMHYDVYILHGDDECTYLMILIWWCTLSLIHVLTWYDDAHSPWHVLWYDAVMLYYTLSYTYMLWYSSMHYDDARLVFSISSADLLVQ